MRRRSERHPRADTPSPKAPVALAVAALAVLGFARWWLDRPPASPSLPLDEGSFVTAISPSLRRAGCAAPSCHGGRSPMRLAPALTDAAAALAELDAVRPFAGRGDPAQSALWIRATSRAHAGPGALPPTAARPARSPAGSPAPRSDPARRPCRTGRGDPLIPPRERPTEERRPRGLRAPRPARGALSDSVVGRRDHPPGGVRRPHGHQPPHAGGALRRRGDLRAPVRRTARGSRAADPGPARAAGSPTPWSSRAGCPPARW